MIFVKRTTSSLQRTHSFHSLRQLISVAVNVTCSPFIAIDREYYRPAIVAGEFIPIMDGIPSFDVVAEESIPN